MNATRSLISGFACPKYGSGAEGKLFITTGLLSACQELEGDHQQYLQETYDKAEYMVPMRDGVELYTMLDWAKGRGTRVHLAPESVVRPLR